MFLSQELIEKCKATNTSQEGLEKLIEYYISSLGWSIEQANKYGLSLFDDGTIDEIKIITSKDTSV